MAAKRRGLITGRVEETGAIRKNWRGKRSVVLVYPNLYHLGMSNLGFQAVYRQLNTQDDLVCERAFLPEDGESAAGRLKTVESGRPAAEANILAFSISFENDIPNLLRCLDAAGLPLLGSDRRSSDPLVLVGGVVTMLNPEPLAAFVDCFLIGEAETMLPQFLGVWDPQQDRGQNLHAIAAQVQGAYVPSLYSVAYKTDGTIASFEPTAANVPERIQRSQVRDLTEQQIFNPHMVINTAINVILGS